MIHSNSSLALAVATDHFRLTSYRGGKIVLCLATHMAESSHTDLFLALAKKLEGGNYVTSL